MKSTLLFFILFSFGAVDALFAQDYRIHFLQNGKEVPVLNEKVQLLKKPFQIQVELLKVDGVYGACSFSDSLFQIALNESLPESDLIQWKIAVEPEYNADKDMIVSTESYFYWFYNPKVDTWHRFDPDPIVEKGRVIGTKTIERIFVSENLNRDKKSIVISEMKEPLYFIFFLMDKKNEAVYNRKRIQLDFN
ncbi:MAG: hypothetical protein RIS20_1339 [Bacteroidota bacterium]|jgi:hypothetical protein